MPHSQLQSLLEIAAVSVCCAVAWGTRAGGSGFNTVVVINQHSLDSCQLGNYFCERRHVPPENVLRINWPGTNTSWSSADFQAVLLTPLQEMLTSRQLNQQVAYVVLSMDIPFQTVNGSTVNGTTSALFYGLRSNAGDPGVTNSYAASEAAFDQARPASAPGFSFLATMITADTLAQAKLLVDRGVASDGSFPRQSVILAKSSDPVRNIRYTAFDNAIFNVNVRGAACVLRTNTDSLWGGTQFFGYQTGLANFAVPDAAFVPGAIADNMTSYGGIIFGPNSQTSLLAMIEAGASGSYGTVAEPLADQQKFPNPQVYFCQSRGFSLAESYYQSLNAPYLGLIVAEPLSAPFTRPGSGRWLSTNVNLSGIAPLAVRFSAPNAWVLQQMDLFVDGKYYETLTNAAPQAGNVLNLSLNGFPVTYVVPTNASLGLVTTGLAAVLNAPAVSNITKIVAYPHGDRVELHSLATNRQAESLYFNHTLGNSNSCWYRVTYLPDDFPPQLTPLGLDRDGAFRLHVDIASTLPYVIEASTDLTDWVPVFTNFAGGLLDFTDCDAAEHARRFYRVVESVLDPRPQLSLAPSTNDSGLNLHIETAAVRPYAIQASTDLHDWTSLFTNQVGGGMDFVDAAIPNETLRFYRTWNVRPAAPSLAIVDITGGNVLMRVDNALRPFVLEASINQAPWAGLATNYVPEDVPTVAGSSIGSADALTTFLSVGRSAFLASEAFGRQQYLVTKSLLTNGAYLQFTITKTNAAVVIVGLTNLTAGESSTNLARQFYDLLNATPSLQSADGVIADDFNVAGAAFFNIRPRRPGWRAADIQVVPEVSGLTLFPSAPVALTQNLADLRPRNHLYVTAGTRVLGLNFTLDTRTLADGYHELTAVAYEGSHVRTQTRATLPVIIQNTSLKATLTLLDLPDSAPVQGHYHIHVTADTTSDISIITLCSTGGPLATVTNQTTAIFQVDGASLGVGRHPFYALVHETSGLSYRTETKWVRLISGQ